MAQVDALYRWLETLPAPRAEEIFAAALEHAEPAYAERIIGLLLTRNTEAAWTGLLANWPRLGRQTQDRLRCQPQRWRAALVLALQTGTPRARCQALSLLAAEPCPSLCYLLPDALRATSEEVRQAAALTLRKMAEAVLEPVDLPTLERQPVFASRDGRAEVAGAVREALQTFELHYRREVLEISLWFARDLGSTLWEMLNDPRNAGTQAVRQQLPRCCLLYTSPSPRDS